MAKGSNIVHQYFRKQFDGFQILVKVNPIMWTGTEITRTKDGEITVREDLIFDENVLDDLKHDGFEVANPIEFNLYLSGLA